MGVFSYNAVGRDGARVRGTLTLPTREAVFAELASRSLTPVEVSEVRERAPLLRRRPSSRVLSRAYGQMGDLLTAGVPLLRGLELLAGQKSAKALVEAWGRVRGRVSDGGELAEAMAAEPGVFPDTHVAMVRAGERGGFLEQVLSRLGEMLEREADLKARVTGAMVYPSVLVSVGAVMLGVVFTMFVPGFREQFGRRLNELPFVTEVVFFVSDMLTRYGLVTLGVLVAAGVGAVVLWRDPAFRERVARGILKLPIIGSLVRSLAIARFCRMLGTMETNGVPLLEAMRIARDAAGHPVLVRAVNDAVGAVRDGRTLARPLGESGFFPDEVVEMIAVGEASGTVGEVLLGVATTLEKRSERTLTAAVQLVEPVLLLTIGVSIGFVALGLILPLFELTASV